MALVLKSLLTPSFKMNYWFDKDYPGRLWWVPLQSLGERV